MALALMWSISSLTTLKLTSASSSAMRISRRASSMFSSVILAWPRRVLKARWSFSCRFSNIEVSGYFSSRARRPQLSAFSCQFGHPVTDRPVADRRMRLFHLRPYHVEPVSGAAVLEASHAADQVERVAVELSVFEQRVIDVNGDNLSDDQTASRGLRIEI